MPLTILPREESWQSTLGSGLAQGLNALTQNKMKQIHAAKTAELFQNSGYTPEASHLLAHLQQQNPDHFHNVLSQLGQGARQQMQGQDGQQYQPIFGGSSGVNDIQQQKLDQARDLADEKKNEPFLKGLAEDYRNAQVLRSKAKSMLENLRKNKSKFPGQTKGLLVEKTGTEKWLRDPNVRKYLADSTSLVTALANSRKGQPTNFKLKFEQLSKPDLTMPFETQEALLQDIIMNTDKVFRANKFISSQKESNQGKVPGDIRERLISSGLEDLEVGEGIDQGSISQFQSGQELDELPKASSVPVGTEVEYGKDVLVSDGTSWKKKR